MTSKKYTYLPSTIISYNPNIFICYFEDYIKNKKLFEFWVKNQKLKLTYVIFMFGWHYESAERIDQLKKDLNSIRSTLPEINIIFLANSNLEKKNIENIGERVVFCNKNVFLKECRYKVSSQKKIYDAIYIARITPFKRHHLALKIPNLLLIGSYSEKEKKYAENTILKFEKEIKYIRKVKGVFIYRYINQAKVGLALSDEEGAMYAAIEYGLCGIPLVTTRNKGGREFSLSPEYVHVLETDIPTAENVASAVDLTIEKKFSPERVRAATIQIAEQHRERFRKLIKNLFDESGSYGLRKFKKSIIFPHKFGLRKRVSPIFKYFKDIR